MKALVLLFGFMISSWHQGGAQNLTTSTAERIDTIVVYDTETEIEEIKIIEVSYIKIEADFCDSFDQEFKTNIGFINASQAHQLSDIELNCNGQLQAGWTGGWEIKSFDLVFCKPNQVRSKITNPDGYFSELSQIMLRELNYGDLLIFEQMYLAHPQKGEASIEFTMKVK